ncbi:CAMK family protein kinase [Trichomonas vaginalis G3]|uniref:CAMK family protein kinase n=1 Tax=Trichomonas vaginalis (strain ATCC PRA-98 / G3) TaxID=412133 RepID=A2EJ00_TRIV3|nr:protein serine/threonine kinase protein [Trichomonas vaginalis G3]EAY07390.1 CAMK family protein kinase [Trichomonas vaginalis G3]KAI5506543.1 protein serine/threonine kinase protein [Trichomonas vaginalis G3]|eukprot:XP_001319613.1 CAMK family protein kinase [Trichomonas vaginalis G3]
MGEIGSYQLLCPIGEGASSTVYCAKNNDTNDNCCIKLIKKSRSENCFLDIESKVLPTLNHPNIVKFIDFLEDVDNFYLVEELCCGETLTHYMESGKILTDSAILSIMQQLLSAIQYIHYKGISHRDLKTDNIIISNANTIKLIDFGLSTDNNSQMRATFCGSVAFASPECINHLNYDSKSADIWSCGVICYYLATGSIPWKGKNIVQIMRSITTVNYTIPSTVSLPVKSIIQQCLQLDPVKRPSASKLLESPFFSTKVRRSPRLLRVENSCGQFPKHSIVQPPAEVRKSARRRPKIYSL